MIPYKLIDTAIDQGTTLRLYQRGKEFSIRVDKAGELMNSRAHHSEEALADLACEQVAERDAPHLLVGGAGYRFYPGCGSFPSWPQRSGDRVRINPRSRALESRLYGAACGLSTQ